MILTDLVQEVERLLPSADPITVARLTLLLSLRDPTLQQFRDRQELSLQLQDVQYRIQATTDQHAAVAEELDSLASSDPCEFSPDHVWTLIRAIKVQSFLLEMYLEPTVQSEA